MRKACGLPTARATRPVGVRIARGTHRKAGRHIAPLLSRAGAAGFTGRPPRAEDLVESRCPHAVGLTTPKAGGSAGFQIAGARPPAVAWRELAGRPRERRVGAGTRLSRRPAGRGRRCDWARAIASSVPVSPPERPPTGSPRARPVAVHAAPGQHLGRRRVPSVISGERGRTTHSAPARPLRFHPSCH
jgi:hypothetical protein